MPNAAPKESNKYTLIGAQRIAARDSAAWPRSNALPPQLMQRILAVERACLLPLSPGDQPCDSFGPAASQCLAIPFYVREAVEEVLCLWIGRGNATVEIWTVDKSESDGTNLELGLAQGSFGELTDFFRVTALTRFRHGEGLPGVALQRRAPVVYPSLSASSAFLRAAAAETAGLRAGLSFPVLHPRGADVIAVLLGASEFANFQVDLWRAATSLIHNSHYDFLNPEGTSDAPRRIAAELAEQSRATLRPSVLDADALSAHSLRFGFAYPTSGNGSVPHLLTVIA